MNLFLALSSATRLVIDGPALGQGHGLVEIF